MMEGRYVEQCVQYSVVWLLFISGLCPEPNADTDCKPDGAFADSTGQQKRTMHRCTDAQIHRYTDTQIHCYLAERDRSNPPTPPYYPYRFLFLHCHQIGTQGTTDHLVTIATGIEHPMASSTVSYRHTYTQMPLVLKEFLNILPMTLQ